MTKKQHHSFYYGKIAKGLHWGMALVLLVLILVGSYMTGLETSNPTRFQLVMLHKSFGVIFMQLAVFRVIWRHVSSYPKLPNVLANWERRLSKGVTLVLYALMLMIPLSGIAMTNFSGFSISLFGVVEIPPLFDKDLPLAGVAKQVHVILVYGLLVALFLHVSGALKHRFLDSPEADLLPRMLPIKPRS
ncbi:cytochrome B [Salinivibrio sp. IB574]|uniref:cytochrome b n=1 Tax=Salinivibrio sp. IB574 TaxID=1909444 RepID=UPI0009894967|nr:cytochrome b [Salinivibrio sp. IB574]OOF21223.1 cytochrome B [Salinivibrio sp. IB574]